MFGDAAEELAKISKRAAWSRRRERVCQIKMTREIGEPEGIVEMVGQAAEAIAFLAVDEVEPGKRAAESGLAIILQCANHGNGINALDSLREPRYSHVMSIAQIARYMPATTLSIVTPARYPS